MTTVLFIDLNRNIREYCGRWLEREGYRVVLMRSPPGNAARVRAARADVVVIDADEFEAGPGAFGALLASLAIPVILYQTSVDYELSPSAAAASACVQKSGDLAPLVVAIERAAGHMRRRTDSHSPLHSESTHARQR